MVTSDDRNGKTGLSAALRGEQRASPACHAAAYADGQSAAGWCPPAGAAHLRVFGEEAAGSGVQLSTAARRGAAPVSSDWFRFSVRSELRPVKEAEQVYDEGLADGHLAVMARGHRDGIVNLAVGNLKPNDPVTVWLEMLAGVDARDDSYRFRFPFTLAAVVPSAGADDLARRGHR